MKKHLMVVDDDSAVRQSLKRVLSEAGYEVTVAADGNEGEAQLRERPADLLILDLNMPGRDGWTVLANVGSLYPLMPIVLITGFIQQIPTPVQGVAALLEKPIEAVVLLKVVEDLLAETEEDRLRRITGTYEVEAWWRLSSSAEHDEHPKPAGSFSRRIRSEGDSISR